MKQLWLFFAVVLVLSFSVLGWIGTRIYQEAPPVAQRVVTTDGRVVIRRGRDSGGTKRLAIAWRHGSRLDLGPRQLCRPRLDGRLAAPRGHVHPRSLGKRRRSQTDFDAARRRAASPTERTAGRTDADQYVRSRKRHDHDRSDSSRSLRGEPGALLRRVLKRRTDYAIPAGAVTRQIACGNLPHSFSGRPGQPRPIGPTTISATRNNWPYEPLVANRPTGEAVVWTGVSIIMLLAGISAMAWWYAVAAGARRNRSIHCPRSIRWEAGKPRRRSGRRSSISGLSRL